MKKYLLLAILSALTTLPYGTINAQEKDHTGTWTLEQCIAHALKNNIELKSEKLSTEESKISLSDSKWAFAPSLSASTSYNISIGRVLDETTYDFVTNQVMGSSGTSISASLPLFNGLRSLRQLQYSKMNQEAASLNYKKAENDLTLNITAYFLETLCAQENIKNCESIVKSLKKQEELTAEKVKHGKVTTADLLQIQSQLADAENTLLTAIHNYDMARINICQILEITDFRSFNPQNDLNDSITSYVFNDYYDITENADYMPEIRLAKKNISMSKKNIQIAKSQYYPILSLSAGYGTSYSNARQKNIANPDGSYTYRHYPFWEQYADNASQYIAVSLSIPLFSNLSTINNVKRAKIELQRAEYDLETAKKQMRKEMLQALMDAETAWKKYEGSKKFLNSASEAARQITIKYEAGAASVLEYNNVMTSLIEAQTQYLSSKYEYIFKMKVLSFYKNGFTA